MSRVLKLIEEPTIYDLTFGEQLSAAIISSREFSQEKADNWDRALELYRNHPKNFIAKPVELDFLDLRDKEFIFNRRL